MPASLNRYAYAYDSPLRYTDPSGNEPFTIAGLLLIAFLSVVAINTVRQDMEVRSGQRRVEDFSLSEAAVNGTVIGNSYSAVTGQDAVTSRQLSGAERALAGVEVGLEFVSVGGSALRATTQSARVARAANVAVNAAQTAQAGLGVYRGGSATAEMLREGRYGAAALTGLLTAASGAGGYQSAKGLRGSLGVIRSELSAAGGWLNRRAPRLNPFNYSFEGMGMMGRNPKYVSPELRAARQERMRLNQLEGSARETNIRPQLEEEFPGGEILEQRYLRDSSGNRLKDPVTGEGRRLDFVVLEEGQVKNIIEVTSPTALKADQLAKTQRIRALGKENGGVYIRRPRQKELISVPEDVVEEVRRIP